MVATEKNLKKFKKPLDKLPTLWYNKNVKRESELSSESSRVAKKNSKNPLTSTLKSGILVTELRNKFLSMGLEIWETVKSGLVRTPTRLDPIQKITEKKSKKLLTSSHKGAIIKPSKGETPHPKKGIDTMEKMTYVKALDVAISAIADGEAKDKLVALKASIAKKNGAERKPTATQTANEGFKVAILDAMEVGKGYTITDLMKSVDAIADLSNQRVSAIVRQMVESGDVVREEIKRKAYFSLATSTDEVEGE